MNRYLNDVFSYCRGNPKTCDDVGLVYEYDYHGNQHSKETTIVRCREDARGCPLKQNLGNQLRQFQEDHPQLIPESLAPIKV